MNTSLSETFRALIRQGEELVPKGGSTFDGYNGHLQPDYASWRLQTFSAVEDLGSPGRPLLKELEKDKQGSYFFQNSASIVLGVLKAGLVLAEKVTKPEVPTQSGTLTNGTPRTSPDTVFIVHGHDDALLQQVARFLVQMQIKPIILFEQAGKGQTIIEKLESNCNVAFSIVLLTPDDLGKSAKSDGQTRPRARQNVILELGYFIGKLGRSNVIAIYDESVEIPSDYRGVEYIKIDTEGAWKLKLAREMKEAKLSVDMNNAI
jgi:predicted nucleotide-binding protein